MPNIPTVKNPVPAIKKRTQIFRKMKQVLELPLLRFQLTKYELNKNTVKKKVSKATPKAVRNPKISVYGFNIGFNFILS